MYIATEQACKVVMKTKEYQDILCAVNANWEKIYDSIEPTDDQGYSNEGTAEYNGVTYYFSYHCGDCDARPFLNLPEEVAMQIYEEINN